MARVEELVGYGLSLLTAERQARGEDGQPIFNGGAGGPKLETVWILVFTGPAHTVKITLDKAAKDALVGGLTGGIEVASEMPDGPG